MEILSLHRCFGGIVGYYAHHADSTNCRMRFTVFVPPQALAGRTCATVFFLSGLTSSEENFTTKAGAYRMASELGLIVVTPDTSPRGEKVPTGADGDLGYGAGFYIDATQEPWRGHYRMETYVAHELFALVLQNFPADAAKIGIFGHSMGGHGALTLALKYPRQYRSLSAFAPICAPTLSPWGKKVFSQYLGGDASAWEAHDATALLLKLGRTERPILIDQGMSDQFLERLHPHLFEQSCEKTGQNCTLRRHEGYDHGYFFIQTFIDDHLRHHAEQLGS